MPRIAHVTRFRAWLQSSGIWMRHHPVKAALLAGLLGALWWFLIPSMGWPDSLGVRITGSLAFGVIAGAAQYVAGRRRKQTGQSKSRFWEI
jgi:hypothetical protein